MREEKKRARMAVISEAAYTVLAQKGYDGASMLTIAKAAQASNETLYRWYGDKRGLFAALVQENAGEVAQALTQAMTGPGEPMAQLRDVAPVFLRMLLGEKAISLNMAAASDPTGELGAAISAGGRDVVQPLFQNLLVDLARERGVSSGQLTAWFLGVLVGDAQVRRMIGVQAVLSEAEIEARVDNALLALERMLRE